MGDGGSSGQQAGEWRCTSLGWVWVEAIDRSATAASDRVWARWVRESRTVDAAPVDAPTLPGVL